MKTLLCAAVVLAAGCAPVAVHPTNWVTSERSALETAPESAGPAVAAGGPDLSPAQQPDEGNSATALEGVDWAEFFAPSSASPPSARVAARGACLNPLHPSRRWERMRGDCSAGGQA